MEKLLTQLQENATFVLITGLFIVAVALLSHLAEQKLPHLRTVSAARRVSIIGICSAIAVVLHVLDFPLVFLAPEFYKLTSPKCLSFWAASFLDQARLLPLKV